MSWVLYMPQQHGLHKHALILGIVSKDIHWSVESYTIRHLSPTTNVSACESNSILVSTIVRLL